MYSCNETGKKSGLCKGMSSGAVEEFMSAIKKLQTEALENKLNKFGETTLNREVYLTKGEVSELEQAIKEESLHDIAEEAADVAIYLLGIAELAGFDLGFEIVRKMAINDSTVYSNGVKTRPPKKEIMNNLTESGVAIPGYRVAIED